MKKSKMLKVIATILMLTFMIQMVPFSAIAAGDEITEILDPESIITEIPYDTTSDESPETKEIVSEETAKRSENEKHFKLEDGSFVIAQYPDAVHYEDENGNWIDIDNTLIAEEATDANDFDGYTNKGNDFNVKLAEDGKDQLLRIEEGDFSISMKLDEDDAAQSFIAVENNNNVATITDDMSVEEKNDQTMQLDKLTSKAEYSDILPGIDIEYTVQSNGVKEYIVVNERRDEYVFSFELELSNLVVRENEDGSISLMTSDSEEKYVIPAPYMFDANEQYSDAVSYTITNIGSSKYTLTVTADEEWINSNNTTFPVRIDPTIKEKQIIEKAHIYDNFVADAEDHKNSVFNDERTLWVGQHSTYGTTRAYITWLLPVTLLGSNVVTSVKLNYYLAANTASDSSTIEARKVTSDWSSANLTWTNKPEHSIDTLDCVVTQNMTQNTCIELDITDAFKLDTNNGANKYFGVVLKAIDESSVSSAVELASSDYTNDPNDTTQINCWPTLEIYYQTQKGLDSDYSYIPFDCGDAGTAYINAYNGDLNFVTKSITSNTFPLEFNYVFNTYMNNTDKNDFSYDAFSCFFKDIEVGKGWKLSFQDTIIPLTNYEFFGDFTVSYPENEIIEDYAYLYNDHNGSYVYLVNNPDGETFIDQNNLGYVLSVNVTNDEKTYTLTTPDGCIKTFKVLEETLGNISREKGYITSSAFTHNGNNVILDYDYSKYFPTELDSILVHGTRNRIGFTYDYNGVLDKIDIGTEKSILLSYGPSITNKKYLTTIDDNAIAGYTSFTYDQNTNKMSSVNSSDGNTLYFSYNTEGRISSVIWENEVKEIYTETTFDYVLGETTVHYFGLDGENGFSTSSINNDDIYITIGFDGNGLSDYLLFENNGIQVFDDHSPYGLRGIENIAINNPSLEYSAYMNSKPYVATSGFDHNTNISEMYSLGKNTITLSNDSHSGGYSYLVSTQTYENPRREQSYLSKEVVLTEGTHTFSAYIKCEDGIKIPTGEIDENNEPKYTAGNIKLGVGTSNYSEIYITEKTNGWKKLTKTFNLTAPVEYNQNDFITTLYIWFTGVGNILVDDVMIDGEHIHWPAPYVNKGVSSGFEGSDISWDVSADNIYQRVTNTELYSNYGTVSGVEPANVYEGMYALKIEGEEDKEKSVHYIHYLNSTNLPTKGFTLSGWGKINNAIPENDEDYGFELFAYYVYYVDVGEGNVEMRTKSVAIPFDPISNEWQHVSQTFTLPEINKETDEIYSITFGALYKNAEGVAYFDNIELLPVTE